MASAMPAPQDGQTKRDNTKVNQRDKNPGEAAADSQKSNADDHAQTAKIRKAVMADKSLSTYAHNVQKHQPEPHSHIEGTRSLGR